MIQFGDVGPACCSLEHFGNVVPGFDSRVGVLVWLRKPVSVAVGGHHRSVREHTKRGLTKLTELGDGEVTLTSKVLPNIEGANRCRGFGSSKTYWGKVQNDLESETKGEAKEDLLFSKFEKVTG